MPSLTFASTICFALHSQPSAAIVILNWNGASFLRSFLPAVLQTAYANLQVIVADNASTDDSVSFLQSNFKQVKIIQLEKNWGFAEGYNQALAHIDADYYVLLNSDVEVEPLWLQPIINWLEKDATHGAAQPKILAYHQRSHFEYAGAAGGWIDALGYPFARGRVLEHCEEDSGQYNDAVQIFWASGAALVVKRKAFWQAGAFDGGFFAHQEEIDLCWRMQLLGYKIFCCPQAVVYHVGGGTLPRGASKKTYLNFRNNLKMLAKNLPVLEAAWKIPLRMCLDICGGLAQAKKSGIGYVTTILKAQAHFLLWLVYKKQNLRLHKRPLISLSGVYRGSMLWQVLGKKKKNFAQVVGVSKK